ncbi:MAG TPA: DUF131 domain-containing protein [Methanotrichaceae archaeon]|nr:DUF131 domain-containing protein [Methanotrichaceae archaeon]
MQLMLLGLGLIVVGILLLIAPEKGQRPKTEENMRESMTESRTEAKGGAIIMIGPIPIVFGSDPRTTAVLMLIALGIMLAWVLALTYRG